MNLFLGIALGSLKGAIVGLLSLIITVIEFQNFATLYEHSAKVLRSWKDAPKRKWFVKYSRACRPLNVRVGSYYYADESMILTILSTVVSVTANLVLTFSYD